MQKFSSWSVGHSKHNASHYFCLYLEKRSKICQSEVVTFLLMAPSNQDNRYLFISKWGLLFPSALTCGWYRIQFPQQTSWGRHSPLRFILFFCSCFCVCSELNTCLVFRGSAKQLETVQVFAAVFIVVQRIFWQPNMSLPRPLIVQNLSPTAEGWIYPLKIPLRKYEIWFYFFFVILCSDVFF